MYDPKALVAFAGAHYVCFALDSRGGVWSLYDDVAVSPVGGWTDVLSCLAKHKLQPTVLFYECNPEYL